MSRRNPKTHKVISKNNAPPSSRIVFKSNEQNDRNIPIKKSINPKQNIVEYAYVKGSKVTCHYMKCLHSFGEAAIQKPNGDEMWYKMGVLHRENGPAVIQQGDQFWYQEGILHRENGPAIIRLTGTQEWFVNGERHRLDGPAIVDSKRGNQNWINGVRQ